MKNEQFNFIVKFYTALFLTLAFSFFDIYLAKRQEVVEAKVEVKEEAKAEQTTEKPEAEEKKAEQPRTQREEIEAYIREVFGEHAEKAFLLLKGKGEGTCAENRNLDPNAVHTNRDGSRDFGLFQINSRYHPVYKLNLYKDWKANVDYAYRMFKNDNYSFKRWTCGRYWKI